MTSKQTLHSEFIVGEIIVKSPYTRSPSQDFRLFGPRPWKILATYEKLVPEQPRPWRKSCEWGSCYGDRGYALPRLRIPIASRRVPPSPPLKSKGLGLRV